MTGDRDGVRSPHPGEPRDGPQARFLCFGEFCIDLVRRSLTRGAERLDIQRKPLDVLVYLARRPGRVVTREELLDAHWRGGAHDDALTRCVGIVRRALEDARDPPRFVETVWGQGYRFIAPVRVEPDPSPMGPPAPGEAEAVSDPPLASGRWARPLTWAAAVLLLLAVAGTAWLAQSPARPEPGTRIAVLPMAWDAPEHEWLARALTDQLAETLARIEGVTVVSRYSAGGAGEQENPVDFGRRVGAELVLASRLTGAEGKFGLSAQLIAVADGNVLWTFSPPAAIREAEPELIGRLVSSVSRSLWANLRVEQPVPSVSSDAYRRYLRGRYYWHQRSETGLRSAIEAYEDALALEPAYADALAGLAESWLLLPLYGAVAPNDALPPAREAALRALEIEPRQDRALAVQGVIAMQYDWDWTRAESLLRQALTLQPNNATAEQWLAELYCYRRRFEECRQHLLVAQGLEPLSPVLRMLTASVDLWSGNYAASAAAYRSALDDAPGFPLALHALGMSLVGQGAWEEAAAQFRSAEPGLGFAVVGGPLVYVTARSGDRAGAEQLFERLEALRAERYVPPTKLAIARLGLGDRELALEWLRRALAAHDDRLVYLAVDPHYRDLHDDPRFREILETVGLDDVHIPF